MKTMETQPLLSDFPKLQCPFLRQTFKIPVDQWQQHGARLGLREPAAYLVVNRVNPGYEWVFEDPDTFAVEKLNGTNVKIRTEGGRLVAVQNRLNVIDPLQIIKGKTFIIEGIFTAIGKGLVKESGEQAGECLGPKIQANPYKLAVHEWYPFEIARDRLRYKSFHEHERTFDGAICSTGITPDRLRLSAMTKPVGMRWKTRNDSTNNLSRSLVPSFMNLTGWR